MRHLVILLSTAVLAVACATSPRAAPGPNPSTSPRTSDSTDTARTRRDTTRAPRDTAAPDPAARTTTEAAGASRRVAPPASPRDSAVATIGSARIAVDYGRPSMRGRKIFGGLVPYDQVWRTGANEATGFVTSADLDIGGTTVPAGSYTLYTLPKPPGEPWLLIINKQTGQWGTTYTQSQDLARIPMRMSTLDAPVEQFTIALEPTGDGVGTLRMTWERTAAEVDVRVK